MESSNDIQNTIDSGTSGMMPSLFFPVIGSIGILVDATALFILLKCNRMAAQIRYYLMSFTLANLLFAFVLTSTVLSTIIISTMKLNFWYLHEYLPAAILRGFLLVSLLQTSLMSLDRIVSVLRPNFYLMYVDPRKSAIGSISLWIVGMFCQTLTSLLTSSNQARKQFSPIEFGSFLVLYCASFSLFLGSTGVMIHYAKIHVSRTFPRNGDKRPSFRYGMLVYKSSFAILLSCGCLILFYLPTQIMVILSFTPKYYNSTVMKLFQRIAYPSIVSQTIVNPILYVFRFSECRRKLYQYIPLCRKCCSSSVSPLSMNETTPS